MHLDQAWNTVALTTDYLGQGGTCYGSAAGWCADRWVADTHSLEQDRRSFATRDRGAACARSRPTGLAFVEPIVDSDRTAHSDFRRGSWLPIDRARRRLLGQVQATAPFY